MSTNQPEQLLHANLQRVFNERDTALRDRAVAELYVAMPVMYEPDAVVEGGAAISAVAGKLLEQFGADFAFVPAAPVVAHHGLAALRWHAGPRNGPVAVTGMDVAEIVDGRIARLWVMLDPPAA
ncbi:hypothetical protein FHS96_003338 [Sphingomonas zeicaulis]|uniref:nuclear transport factor 2 family protein n=1 Tax=Sphingomonas zeicaulis TaxID=1632740 RepID=UPI003D23E5FB